MSDPISDADIRTLAAFRRQLRGFLHFSEAAAAGEGLTPQQHQALLAIRAAEGRALSVGELADALMLRHHSASELATRLETLGLVRRSDDAGDGRRRVLAPTERAEALLLALSEAHREELRRIRPLLIGLLGDL
ncbi:MarR family transcriptional regulator [uncultured Albimonas sp.]|uniref:MarR family winged helix-turn-helix transcriptional regulator n=1 Tax=uncultured Albimonas sp. TaxID=1331701 RepID=UPI0030EC147A|tara:strand:+ start:1306 stop:1707 length:402 start_codon:yes stop_codon:yes gene_type:complete